MAAPFIQALGAESSGINGITCAWPTHVAGDIGILCIESCGGQPVSLTTPNGFVALDLAATGTTTNGTQITLFWCLATSASMASPVVADPGDHVYGRIVTLRGVDVLNGDPWDVKATAVKASASTSASAPAVTTTVAECLVVNFIARDNDSAAAAFSAWTNASLASITELTNSDSGTTSGNSGGFVIAYGVKTTAGSVSATTATVTSSINASITVAFRPAAFPQSLFANDYTGAALDPSVTSSVYSDDALTTPASLTGVVGSIKDRSGRNNYFYQTTAGDKPTWQQDGAAYYLLGDGTGDNLRAVLLADALVGTASSWEIAIACRPVSIASDSGTPYSNDGLIGDAGGYFGTYLRTTGPAAVGYNWDTNADSVEAGVTTGSDVTIFTRLDGGNLGISTDGSSFTTTASGNTGSIGGQFWLLGAYISAATSNSRVYAVVVRSPAFTSGERTAVKAWLDARMPSSGISGAVSATLGNATLSSASTLEIQGAVAKTLDNATLSSTATLDLQAALSKTLADATLSSVGVLELQGALSVTLGDATLASTGAVDIQATEGTTLDDATLAATATLDLRAALSQTLDDATLASSAQSQAEALASLSVTLDDVALAAGGVVDLRSTLASSLEDATVVSAGVLDIRAQINQPMDDATLVATAIIALQATVAATLGDAVLVADGTAVVGADVQATLADATLVSAGALNIQAAVAQALGDVTLVADGQLPIAAALSQSLGDATLVAAGQEVVTVEQSFDFFQSLGGSKQAVVAQTLEDATLAADASLDVQATLFRALADATLSAAGVLETIEPPDLEVIPHCAHIAVSTRRVQIGFAMHAVCISARSRSAGITVRSCEHALQ